MKSDSYLSLVAAQELPDRPSEVELRELAALPCSCCGAPSSWYASMRTLLNLYVFLVTMAPLRQPGAEKKRQQLIVQAHNAMLAWQRP